MITTTIAPISRVIEPSGSTPKPGTPAAFGATALAKPAAALGAGLDYITRAKTFNVEVNAKLDSPIKISITSQSGAVSAKRFKGKNGKAAWKNYKPSGGAQLRVLVEVNGERVWLGTNPDGTLKTSTSGWKAEWSSDWTTLRIFRQSPVSAGSKEVQDLVNSAVRGNKNSMRKIKDGALNTVPPQLFMQWFPDKLVRELFVGKPGGLTRQEFINKLEQECNNRGAGIVADLSSTRQAMELGLDPFDLVVPALQGSGATLNYMQQYFNAIAQKTRNINTNMVNLLKLADTAAKTGNMDKDTREKLARTFSSWQTKFTTYMTAHANNLEMLKSQTSKWKKTEARQKTMAIVSAVMAGLAAIGSIGFGMSNAAAVINQVPGGAGTTTAQLFSNLSRIGGSLAQSSRATNFPALLGSFSLFGNNTTAATMSSVTAAYFKTKVKPEQVGELVKLGDRIGVINRWLLQQQPPSETYSEEDAKKEFKLNTKTDPNDVLKDPNKYGYWKRYTDNGLFGSKVARTHSWKLHILDLRKV